MPDEPIKFRCYRCGKLLGAPARRAGGVATCPQCRAEIQVPEPGPGDPTSPPEPAFPAPEEPREEPLFAALLAPEPAGDPVIPPIRYDPPSIRPPAAGADAPRAADVVLAPAVVLAWSLLVLAAIPSAFVAGLLIGHFVWK
ncbi:hypothetical protein [Paludisphaera soli]|uniref:hypothetical protein n=1 Tax=Paludisphaera soli TaxID=2712865 RepID=UPI0013EC10D1|nr:hypothetical protein [Paludisphaera soli]